MRTALVRICTIFSLVCPSVLFAQDDLVLPGRLSDCLEIQGEELNALRGARLDKLELLIVNNGALRPIPFQVDERSAGENGKLDWVLPMGPKGGLVKDDGLLDADDELVFMAKDLGTQAEQEIVQELIPPIIEIHVSDPLTGKTVVAYLAAASGSPRLSEVDYVEFNDELDSVESPVYRISHPLEFPMSNNENMVKKEAGGSGMDLIDIHKQRSLVTMFFNTLKIEKFYTDWSSELSAYKDGPVRVMRRMEHRLFLAWNIKSPRLKSISIYLRDYFWFPAELNVPFRLSSIVTFFRVYQATDFSKEVLGMQFFSNSVPQGVLMDGVLSPEERELPGLDQEWQLVSGAHGTWFNRIHLGPGLEKIQRALYYTDDAQAEDLPEEEPGIFGKVGWVLMDLENLSGGEYTFRSYSYFPEHFQHGDKQRLLNILDNPLKVKIQTVRNQIQ